MNHKEETKYIGSTRFFIHLLGICSIILLLIIWSIGWLFKIYEVEQELYETEHKLESLTVEYEKTLDYYVDETYKADIENYLQEQDELILSEQVEEDIVKEPEFDTQLDVPYYQNLYPDLFVDEKISFVDKEEKYAYLTFDDGPSATTDSVLAILEEYDVPATFFIMGINLESEQNIERLKAIVDAGHTIAVHTYTHNYSEIYKSVETYLDDFYLVWSKIYEITGVKCDIFRFPGGSINSYNAAVYQEIISELTRRGFVYYDWNVSSEDSVASNVPVSMILENSSKIGNLSKIILLMHDSAYKNSTVSALPQIIELYQKSGYTLDVLDRSVRPTVFAYSR